MKNRWYEGDEPPKELPAPKTDTIRKETATAATAARTCDKCESTNVRIISNYDGQKAFCNSCKHWWSLSMAVPIVAPGNLQRGFSKRTSEQNFDLAYEHLDEMGDPKKDRD